MKKLSVFCWNIANPSPIRAERQTRWLGKRPEDFLILTEIKASEGCHFLRRYFEKRGYGVLFPEIKEGEYGAMMISKCRLANSNFLKYVNFLPSRVTAATLRWQGEVLEIIGVYVPSRDASPKKINKKKHFLKGIISSLKNAPAPSVRILCGDFNILEPRHVPRYSFFKKWEYDFYRHLIKYPMRDVFRCLNPDIQDYSWIGRKGNGYRYDHCFISKTTSLGIRRCFYYHEPRKIRLSDHSAIIAEFNYVGKQS